MEIRRLTPSEIEDAIKLSDKTFRKSQHQSMGRAFPLVFTTYNNLSFGAFHDSKLVSFFGLVPFEIKIGSAQISAFSIGSVCTDPDYRGKGIASAILEKIYQYIDEAGASLLFVSGDRGLYLRNNCFHFGTRNTFKIDKATYEIENGENILRKATLGDLFSVFRLRQGKNVRYETSVSEWLTLLKSGGYTSIFNMQQEVYVMEKKGEITGYVVAGIPNENSMKAEPIITEWGGESSCIKSILESICLEFEAFDIRVPWHDDLNKELQKDYAFHSIRNGGTIHIVQIERLNNQILPYLEDKSPRVAEKLSMEYEDTRELRLNYKGESVTLTHKEFIETLFSPGDNVFPDLFPVPLPSTEGMEYV
ncbi:GNAT family N-acetyltransferase [Virgibacillus halodenitrificans]|uniref:GNAT family N-acetyltransferase n=1 Tax=Virgibacillus halodenitrificans TaxID=1482 RepID=UPI0002F571F1|nr:GNAT family N-acetyltransferase [Virgibacillus halodenitrificans]MYL55952.1 GNAT family N-acetyltransferase [Virgibacillus halodenitrificans]